MMMSKKTAPTGPAAGLKKEVLSTEVLPDLAKEAKSPAAKKAAKKERKQAKKQARLGKLKKAALGVGTLALKAAKKQIHKQMYSKKKEKQKRKELGIL